MFATFTIGVICNAMGHLLKCVKLIFIDQN